MLTRHRQIDDRQHHEYEGLQRNHKQMEQRPDQRQQELHDQEEPAAEVRQCRDALQRQHREQQEHHLAGVEVAVETQRQRDRPRQEGHGLEYEVDDRQGYLQQHVLDPERLQGQLAEETEHTLHLQVVEDDQDEHRERHGEGRVQVGARHHLQMLEADAARHQRQQVDRNEIHEVEQEDPAENGERQWRHQAARTVKGVAHLRIDERNDGLDEVLHAAGYPGGRAVRDQPEEAEEDEPERDREKHGVVVDDREVDDAVRRAVRQEGLVVQDVIGRAATCF